MRTHATPHRTGFRFLLAASALASSSLASAATVSIYDNADQVHFKTTTVDVTTTPPGTTTTTVTGPVLYFGTNAYIDSSPTGWNASSVTTTSTTTTGVTTTTTTTVDVPLNGVQTITGGSVVISSSTNRDVQTTPGGIGLSTFSAYSSLAQATGRYDLYDKKLNETQNRYYNTTGYDQFGTYTDRSTTSPIVGYFIDATDYSGAGNLRWTGASRAVVLAGNNTYTGDTFIAGTAIVQSNIGQGTLFLTSTAEVVFNTVGTTKTMGNAIAGSGKLTFQGDTSLTSTTQATTLTYDSVNYSGSIRIETGINGLNNIILGDGSTVGATANTGTLGIGSIDVGRMDGNLGGGAYALTDLAQSKTSQLTFQLGGTKTISNATINLHAQSALENIGGAAGDLTVTGAITSGAADTAFITNTSGKLTFTGAVALGAGSYTSIQNNSTQSMTFASTLATSGQIDIANNSTGDLNLNGTVSGLVFIDQNGASTTTLAGNNTFTGIVAVNNAAGTLKFTNANALGAGTIRLAGGTLSLDDGLVAVNTVTLSNAVNLAASSTLSTTDNLIFTGAFTSPAAGTVLTKDGSANLILTGNNDTYSGTFTIAAGTLQAGNGGTSGTFGTQQITLAGATSADAIVAVNRSDSQGVTVGNYITGTGSFEQNGTGLTIMTGANDYTGTTSVNAGTLRVGNNGTVGQVGAGAVTVASGATLEYKRSDSITVSNAITGTGTALLSHTGSGDLTLSGSVSGLNVTNNTATLTLSNAGNLGNVANSGTALNITSASAGTLGTVTNSAGTTTLTGVGDIGAVTATAGTVDVTGTGKVASITASGASTVTTTGMTEITGGVTATNSAVTTDGTLKGASSVSGGSQLTLTGGIADSATIALHNGSNLYVNGATTSAATVTNADNSGVSLRHNAATTTTLTGAIGAGSSLGVRVSVSSGALNLTNTANKLSSIDYAAGASGTVAGATGSSTNFVDGTVTFGNGSLDTVSTLGASAGNSVSGSLTLSTGSSFTLKDVSGAGTVTQSGSGTVTLADAVNDFSGTYVISAGRLAFDDATDLNSATVRFNNGALAYVGAGTTTVSNNLEAVGGSLSYIDVDSATGQLVLNGAINLTGTGTAYIYKRGTGTLDTASLLVGMNVQIVNTSLDIAGANLTTNNLNDTLAYTNTGANANLVVNQSGSFSGTASGVISGDLNLVKDGTGTLILAADNTYIGTTTVNAGVLQIGAGSTGGSLGTGAVTIASGATLTFNKAAGGTTVANDITNNGALTATSGDIVYSGVISGSGVITQTLASASQTFQNTVTTGGITVTAGSFTASGDVTASALVVSGGSATLSGNNTIGTTTLTGGTLNVNSDGAVGSLNLSGGTLALGGAGVRTLAGAVNISGPVAITASVNSQFAGVITSTSDFSVDAGSNTVTFAAVNALGVGTTVSVGGSTTLAVANTGALGEASVSLGSGTTLAFTAGSNGSYANTVSGAGSVSQSGSGVSTITGANTYTGGTVITSGGITLAGSGSLGTGSVSNAGVLTDSRASATLANSISGTGSFVRTSGTTTVTGVNTYTGGTSIQSGGAIILAGSGSLGTGDITNAGTLTDTRATGVISGVISGTGSFVRSGLGSTTLSGVNTYTGGTTVTGGTLIAGSDSAFGTGSVSVTGGSLDLNGHVVSNALSFSGTGALTGSGTIGGVLTATNYSQSSGSIIFAANNNLTGTTTVTGGSLTVGTGGTTGTIGSGAITIGSAGTLAFNRSDAVTLTQDVANAGTLANIGSGALTASGALTGSGTVQQSGTGSTTLTNASAFSGAYSVTGGTLALDGQSGSFTNAVTGSGTFALTGAGTTTLSSSVLNSGAVLVGTGHTLDLGTSRTRTQQAAITVQSGATLSGQGATGSITVQAGGSLRPGNSPGIINVNGNLVNNGTVTMEIAGNGAAGAANGYDQVNATGTVTLNGTVLVTLTGGFNPSGTGTHAYTLFTSGAGSITGSALTSISLPTTTLGLIANTGSALTYTSYDSFSTLPGASVPSGLNAFDKALVAAGTGAGTGAGALLNVYNTQGATAAQAALVNASPLGLAAMNTLAIDEARGTNELIRNRLDWQRRTPVSSKEPITAYANVTGQSSDTKASEVANGGANFDRNYFGGKAGLERAGRGGVAVGGNLGYDRGRASLLNGGGRVDQDHLSASGYISHLFNKNTFMYLGVFGGLSKYEASRNTVLGKAEGDTQGWDLGVSALVGKEIVLTKECTITPYAGLVYTHAEFSAYDETGAGALNLAIADNDQDSLRSKLGADIDWKLPTGNLKTSVGLGVVWEHELLDEQVDLVSSFAGSGSTFRTQAGTMAKDIIGFGPHADLFFDETTSVRLGYQYQYGFGDEVGHRVDITFSKRF